MKKPETIKLLNNPIRWVYSAQLSPFILAPLLIKLRLRYPDMPLQLHSALPRDAADDIVKGSADIGLLSDRSIRRGLKFEHLISDEFCLVAPTSYHDLPKRICAHDLRDIPLILPCGEIHDIAMEWASKQHISLTARLVLDDLPSIKVLVSTGVGCSILPKSAIASEVPGQRFVTRPLNPLIRQRIGLFYSEKRPQSATLKACKQIISSLSY